MGKDNIIFRPMEPSDFDGCAKELMLAFGQEPWNEKWTYSQALSRIEELMSASVSRGYVAMDGDMVVSMMCGRLMTYLDCMDYRIDEFSVHPEYQRMGIGSLMMDYVKREISSEARTVCITLVTEKGFPSVAFYEKNGLKQDDNSVFMIGKV